MNFTPLVYENLSFYYCSSVFKALRKIFLNGTGIAKIVRLFKKPT